MAKPLVFWCTQTRQQKRMCIAFAHNDIAQKREITKCHLQCHFCIYTCSLIFPFFVLSHYAPPAGWNTLMKKNTYSSQYNRLRWLNRGFYVWHEHLLLNVLNTTGTCQHEEGQPIQLITRLFIYRYIVHTYVGRYRQLRSIKKARTLPGDLYKMKIRATCPRVFWNMLKVIHTLHTLKWPYLKRKESKQVSRALIH